MVLSSGREVEGRGGVGEEVGELLAAVGQGLAGEVLAIEGEEIEEDDGGGGLLGEELDARGGGMDAKLEGVEIEAAGGGDDDFSVEDALVGELGGEDGEELGEVTVEGLAFAALKEEVLAVFEEDGAEAVPLGLEEPVIAGGQGFDAFGEHGLDGGLEGHEGRPPTEDGFTRGWMRGGVRWRRGRNGVV